MTDLTDRLAKILRSSLDDKALVTALNAREADMRERRERFETRAQKKRDLVFNFMERAEIKKIAVPDFTANLRASRPNMVVVTESEIPKHYWISQDPKLDRKKMRDALKVGNEIPGAALTNAPPTLTVKTK